MSMTLSGSVSVPFKAAVTEDNLALLGLPTLRLDFKGFATSSEAGRFNDMVAKQCKKQA
jgi:hypothetical protein